MKQKMDLANKKIAEQSKNKTAMIGVIIMNVVLALAYLIELVKGARAAGSYAIVAALCIECFGNYCLCPKKGIHVDTLYMYDRSCFVIWICYAYIRFRFAVLLCACFAGNYHCICRCKALRDIRCLFTGY